MEHEDSLSSSSSDQPMNCQGWERFLPERPLRILLVEDDSSTRQVVCALLSKCGYEVSCAYDDSKAWDLLEQSANTFDLVLADAMIPALSGTDLLAKIMSSESHCDMPVIMMSAHDSLDMVFKCLLKGAKDFLVKPLRKNELRNLWQHVWRRNHASGGHGSHSYVHVTKRKTLKNLSFDDVSKDNLSVSTGIDDKFVSENGRDAQVTYVCQSDQRSRPPDVRSEHNQAWTPAKEPLSPTDQSAHFEKDLEAKTFIFLGSKRKESEEDPVFSEVNLMKHTETSPQICQATGILDLTKRMISEDNAEHDPTGKQGVRQSNCSAFSKYTCNTSLVLQPCNARSQAPPNDQYADGCTPVVLNADIMRRTTAQNCDKVNGIRSSENGNPTTLHFPKAAHFKHRMQAGDSPFLFVSSCCEENSGQVQESSSNFKCPSLNSSTANSFHPTSKGSAIIGNDPLKRMGFQKDGHILGSILCSPGSEKEDFSSSNTKSDRLLPCLNTITDPDKQSLYGQSSMPMDIEESQAYTVVSGRGSNNCSDRGSSMIEEHLTDCGAAQDGHCGSGCWNVSESGRMDLPSGGMHVHDVPNAPDQKPPNIDYSRSSFREAALHKFREKRKLRCFEKRVRYQSRKKLAEQRPRIKGQFVRRATFEKAADTKASILT